MREPTQAPILTIGLPVYNGAPFLLNCLRSVFAQTFHNWELVVVDDGSKDASLEILRGVDDRRVHVLSTENRGLAACLNEITRKARGKFIARMDADDLMHPDRLDKQLKKLDKQTELDGVGCGLVVVDRQLDPIGVRLLPADHAQICANPAKGFALAHATFVGRTEWFRAHPYNESNRGCEDWELWASSFRTSRWGNLSEGLYFYREMDSYSLSKYLRRKAAFSKRLWGNKASEVGPVSALLECGLQASHMLLYTGAGLTGMTDYLLRRRNSPIESAEQDRLRMMLQQILETKIPGRGEQGNAGAVQVPDAAAR